MCKSVVEALDEAEDFAPRFGHHRKTPPVEKLALERKPRVRSTS